jgi:isopentenyl diphosphate isomerase/L-lactate dehydrogenase-like FMN-dependent dehydrogenase
MSTDGRRAFLRFLAGSPLLVSVPASAWQQAAVIADPKEALNVMDFEAAARKALPPAHYGYMATGVDDDYTLQANHEAYRRIQLRPRRLVDFREASLRTSLFGTAWDSPIFICPCGYHRAFHPEGEVATARAARAKKNLMLLSTVTTTPVEEVNREYAGAVWYQLYATGNWAVTEKLVKRAEAAGCPVLVWTIDLMAGRNTETQSRLRRLDTRDCNTCHANGGPGALRRMPMFTGIDTAGLSLGAAGATWDMVERLKKLTSMKVVLKGIETREDAALACEHGADGIIVSNHGGRAEESGRGTIECLPEVVEAARGRVPVMIDGGVRRGSDAFKALALGASAVGIGRPYLWGLSAFGQPGIERVIDILRAELSLVMRQCGARSITEITPSHVKVGSA